MAIRQINRSLDGHAKVGGEINGDVSGGRFQQGIGVLIAGDKFSDNSARSGFGPGSGDSVERDTAAASLSSHRSGGRTQADAWAAAVAQAEAMPNVIVEDARWLWSL